VVAAACLSVWALTCRARARLRRYGLIGRNGIGKTTFLRHLAAKTFEGKSK
jgi:ATPase subunit of ABC transporter with duplicated ATPase domains